jgi:ketosteroid isomerase-like protein
MAEHPHITLVRRGYEAFSKGDMQTLSQVIAHDAVHHVGGDNMMTGDYKGLEAILAYYGRTMEETDGTFKVELESLAADGHGHVMARHRATATRRGKTLVDSGGLFFEIMNNQAIDIIQLEDDLEATDRFWVE